MPGIKRLTSEELKNLGYKFLSKEELFLKYEPNPSELLKSHDAYNERTGFNVSMPGLNSKQDREKIYRDWEMQDASAKYHKKGRV